MDAQKKAMEMQAQVRQSSMEVNNIINDLYKWEKQMKEQEKEFIKAKNNEDITPTSNINVPESSAKARQNVEKEVKQKPVKNVEELQKMEEKRQLANEIKERGNKYIKLCKYQEALDAYTEAIALYPKDAVYYSNRALCHIKMENYYAAIDDCDTAMSIDNSSVKAYYRRMQALEFLGNCVDALRDCLYVLVMDPKNGEAIKSLQRLENRVKNIGPGPHFSSLAKNEEELIVIDTPPHRKSEPTQRINVTSTDQLYQHKELKISDEDIDKIFNSNCGPFIEIKKKPKDTSDARAAVDIKKIEVVADNATKSNTNKSLQNPNEITKQKSTTDVYQNKKPNVQNESIENKKVIEKVAEEPTNKKTNDLLKDVKTESIQIEPKKSEQLETTSADSIRPLPPPPNSAMQFYTNWKELSDSHKYAYLKSINISKLSKILGAGFDSYTLSDILRVIHDHYLPNKESNVAETLLEIGTNSQVSILSLFLSTDDSKMLSDILNTLKEGAEDSSVVQKIAKTFNISVN